MIATLFASPAAKLRARLVALETEVESLEKRATDARHDGDEARAVLVTSLAEGLPVDDWRKKRDAAEKKAADAERDLAAAQEAAVLVGGRLEEAQANELRTSLTKRYRELQAAVPGARAAIVETGRAFSEAMGRLEGLRRDESSTLYAARAAGVATKNQGGDLEVAGLPYVDDVLHEALGVAEGRELFSVQIPIWPTRSSS